MSIERLAGPRTHVCWTPDHTPREQREQVSLVRETDLAALEAVVSAEARDDDLRIVSDYLDWQYAIHGSFATEGFHKALVREDRPMPTLFQAREAIARARAREQVAE